MPLNRDAFLDAAKKTTLPFELVSVPELGEGAQVRVQGLTMGERTTWEMSIYTGKGSDRQVNARRVRETLLRETCRDEKGAKLFTDDDLEALRSLPARVGERLFDAARRVCGMTPEDVAELGNA
jgi:hypothetical protein